MIPTNIEQLTKKAQLEGASEVCIISADSISIEPELANVCKEPRCENYGLSMSCPPNVEGPQGFLDLQVRTDHAFVIRIDVPKEILFSNDRDEVMRLLHEIVAGIEIQAVALGYSHSKGFAGGPCKTLFCREHSDCRVLAEKGSCRHPDGARPSMSGHGIDVGKMMQAAGWSDKTLDTSGNLTSSEMSWIAGVVMIG